MASEQPSKHPFRLGLIGCGAIAQAHLEAGNRTDEVVWQQVVDLDEQAVERAALAARCEGSTDYKAAGLADDLDGVVICTTPNTHFEIASHFLSHGVAVLCEKPLVLDLDEGRQLAALAESKQAFLMMASKFRYVADVAEAKRRIEAGDLGELVLYQNTFSGRVAMDQRWNSNPTVSGGGVLIDNGTHSVDLARYLLGPLSEVQAQLAAGADDAVEHSARVLFRTQSPVLGEFDLSWVTHDPSGYFVKVFGREAELQVGWGGSRVRRQGEWENFGTGYDKFAALGGQLSDFAASARAECEPRISVEDALASLTAIRAAYRSAETGRAVRLDELEEPR